MERAVLHQDGADGAASAVEFRFEHQSAGRASRSGFQFLEVGGQADHFHQQIEIGFLFCRNIDEHCLAAPLFGDEAAVGELFFDALGQGSGFIDLVDGDDDGNLGGVRVVDGFDGLGHDAVIGGGDEHDDVGGFGSARTHAGEGFVTGRIEEDDLASEGGRRFVGDGNLVCADVLGDAASFASGYVGGADGIEERGLAVIDVAHDGDNGRTRDGFRAFLAALDGGGGIFRGLFLEGDDFGVGSEEARHFAGELGVEGLIDGGEHAANHEARDYILGANAELLGQVFYGNAFRNCDVARDRRGLVADGHARRRSVALHRAFFDSSRHISLTGTARRRTRTGTWTRRSWRSHSSSGAYAERTRSGGRHARRMHGPTFAGTKRRTRRSRR